MNETKGPRSNEAEADVASESAGKPKSAARNVDDLPDGSGNDSIKHRHGDSEEDRYDAG
ncbi:hypothetical protein [Paeniglutamicibacter kerguelensis]|uniref:Uncharacterized protein n=1 Tax=Paeniglutamicibacter kerguelensis TaxID=254788 RepID=A0ABS4XAR1_9MICC|nr:hypothetical protein [Paeniglutamicibacter kerguelensis]MBP2384774.1 hypothetical protein [Paeniglutamicibacter kerguelensis]